jgi:hypothetical protein
MKKLTKCLDLIWKVIQIICTPVGAYITIRGAFYVAPAVNTGKSFQFTLSFYDPNIYWIITGLILVVAGAFFMGHWVGRRKKG